ncbi:hypothetical protein LJC74_08630 [Eubacteriales bacterium OttesenSCG-928-A19]|nr:hypothetical protein [Eubacteriales bacterium OttesenSCG-928-A19]
MTGLMALLPSALLFIRPELEFVKNRIKPAENSVLPLLKSNVLVYTVSIRERRGAVHR